MVVSDFVGSFGLHKKNIASPTKKHPANIFLIAPTKINLNYFLLSRAILTLTFLLINNELSPSLIAFSAEA